MEYRMLGKSTLSISRIGFGCMSLGDHDADNDRLLHAAIDKGINFFDTADLYQQGRNEITVGKALKEKRQDVVIATKVGNQWKKDGSGWTWNPRKEYILAAVHESLQRLQTDYIDLYQLHGGTMEDDINETIEAFTLLQQQGKIRYFGISSIRPNVIRSYTARANIVSVMMQYSLLDRRPEESCLPLLANHQVGVLARGSLAGGLLVDKEAKNYLQYSAQIVHRAAAAIQQASNHQRSKTAASLQYVLSAPAIASAIVGIRTMDQLHSAVSAIEQPALNSAELTSLQEAIPKNYYKEHR